VESPCFKLLFCTGFVNATKDIGIETTFNDDQGALVRGMGGVTWEGDMLRGVGIHMLHGLVELFTGA
jgi:hypothetical protein